LLGAKVTEEVARVRGIPVGSDALSPCRYYDVQTIDDMKHMVEFLRDVTNYQFPILFKLGPSRPYEDVSACIEVGADAISLDGLIGGTGCSPNVVTQGVGIPTIACLPPAVQALKDHGVHRKVKLIALMRLVSAARLRSPWVAGFVTPAKKETAPTESPAKNLNFVLASILLRPGRS